MTQNATLRTRRSERRGRFTCSDACSEAHIESSGVEPRSAWSSGNLRLAGIDELKQVETEICRRPVVCRFNVEGYIQIGTALEPWSANVASETERDERGYELLGDVLNYRKPILQRAQINSCRRVVHEERITPQAAYDSDLPQDRDVVGSSW